MIIKMAKAITRTNDYEIILNCDNSIDIHYNNGKITLDYSIDCKTEKTAFRKYTKLIKELAE